MRRPSLPRADIRLPIGCRPIVCRPIVSLLTLPLLTLILVTLLVVARPAGAAPDRQDRWPPAGALTPTVPVGEWPLDPRPDVVAVFVPPSDPWGAGHRGVDLAGHPGQVVRTALPGTIAFAGSIGGKPVVTVDHGGLRTTYEPVVAEVSVGDVVAGGDPIGRLAVLHGHCLPAACLHWGLLRGDEYLDPLSLVGGGSVRLLPLWRDVPASLSSRPWQPPLDGWRPPLAGLPRHLPRR